MSKLDEFNAVVLAAKIVGEPLEIISYSNGSANVSFRGIERQAYSEWAASLIKEVLDSLAPLISAQAKAVADSRVKYARNEAVDEAKKFLAITN